MTIKWIIFLLLLSYRFVLGDLNSFGLHKLFAIGISNVKLNLCLDFILQTQLVIQFGCVTLLRALYRNEVVQFTWARLSMNTMICYYYLIIYSHTNYVACYLTIKCNLFT